MLYVNIKTAFVTRRHLNTVLSYSYCHSDASDLMSLHNNEINFLRFIYEQNTDIYVIYNCL